MKKLLAVLLMIMVLPCTGHAFPVTINDAGTGANTSWYFQGNPTFNSFAGVIDTSIGEVYCVELGQGVSPGTYNYTPVTPTGAYIGAAWLLNQFGASADTGNEAAGLQAAIWEAIYGMSFLLFDGNPQTVGTIAYYQAQYLAALPTSPTLPPGYEILANETLQNLLITRVPEPMTMLLLGLGLVGLAGLRRKE
jgi:hypothetical protein